MKIRFLGLPAICCLLLFFAGLPANAQIIYIGDPSSAATQKRFNEIFSKNQDAASVPVALTKLLSENTVNTADLALLYPNHKIPFELLKVELPDLSGYTDTLVVLWYLRRPESLHIGTVNVMVIAQDGNQRLAYFVDENNNRNLADDGSPLFFKQGEQQRQIDIRDRRIGGLSFMLQNLEAVVADPKQPEPNSIHKSTAPVPESPVLTRDRRPVAVHLISGLSSGTGDAFMSYKELPRPDSDETDKRYTYTATYFASLNANAGIAVSLYNLYLGASASFELQEVGEQNLVEEFKKRGQATRETIPNTGYWPKMRVSVNGFVEYDFFISNSLRVAPTASFTRYNFIKPNSFVYDGEGDINQYFTDRYSYSVGGKVKYSVSEKSLLFFEVFRRYNHFDASSYFAHVEPGSFDMEFNQFYGGVGLQLKVTR